MLRLRDIFHRKEMQSLFVNFSSSEKPRDTVTSQRRDEIAERIGSEVCVVCSAVCSVWGKCTVICVQTVKCVVRSVLCVV